MNQDEFNYQATFAKKMHPLKIHKGKGQAK